MTPQTLDAMMASGGPHCGKCGHSWFEHSVEPLNPDGSLDGGLVGLCEVAISDQVDDVQFCPCDGFRAGDDDEL